MTDSLRLAHCSDIHLRGGRDDPSWSGFARALAAIRRERPGLMLLAGDLFDANTVPAESVAFAIEALGSLPFPVAMIPGNHDCMAPDAIFRRFDFRAAGNVSLIDDEAGASVAFDALGACVWGRAMAAHAPGFRPLAGAPPRPAGHRWHIGMGHGFFVPRGEESMRASPIREEEIAASGFDYLALGHHHAAMELVGEGSCAAYSGSPTDDVGRGATFALVDLAEGRAPRLEIRLVD